MTQLNLVEFRYTRKHQPEQYGGEEVTIGGTAIVEEGEDAFAVADAMVGRAKAVAYQRLGLKLTKECGAADISHVKVVAVPSADRQSAAPTVTPAEQPDLSLPGVTSEQIKGQASKDVGGGDELPGADEEQTKKRGPGRPKGSGTGTRKTRSSKKAEAAQTSNEPALPDDAGLPGEETPPAAPAVAENPEAEQSEEDALMALLNAGEAPTAPAVNGEVEIDNAALMAACAEAARDKKSSLVTDYLKQVGVDRVLKLDQAQRRSLLAQLAK